MNVARSQIMNGCAHIDNHEAVPCLLVISTLFRGVPRSHDSQRENMHSVEIYIDPFRLVLLPLCYSISTDKSSDKKTGVALGRDIQECSWLTAMLIFWYFPITTINHESRRCHCGSSMSRLEPMTIVSDFVHAKPQTEYLRDFRTATSAMPTRGRAESSPPGALCRITNLRTLRTAATGTCPWKESTVGTATAAYTFPHATNSSN